MEINYPIKLVPAVMSYAWGRIGQDSINSQLIPTEKYSPKTPLAELWYGAHRKAPSHAIINNNELALDQLIDLHSEQILGQAIISQFGPQLPFLLKVLSVRTPLSIQAHPTKELASQLHLRDPAHYPDDNHKPEMAFALSEVTLLYGFQTASEIVHSLSSIPEFSLLLGADLIADLKQSGRTESQIIELAYRSVMQAPSAQVRLACVELYRRLNDAEGLSPILSQVLALRDLFPNGDIGVFALFLLNYVTLQPGQVIFVPPLVPHAYLSGELVECMSCSDNVVRAGLTDKFKDVATLVSMLNYLPTKSGAFVEQTERRIGQHYVVPAREFCLSCYAGDNLDVECKTNSKPHLLLCVRGSGTLRCNSQQLTLNPGDAYLIPASAGDYRLAYSKAQLFCATVP